MSNQGQTTPFRRVDNSPQFFTRTRRESSSPYSKRVAGETALKSIINTTRKTDQLTQKNEKLREFQAKLSQHQQKLTQIQQQNISLEQTLSERTVMYKRIINDQERKTQQTIQSMKEQFRIQFKQLSQQKQEEERFFHEQSSVLNQKIDWLENENAQLQQRLSQQIGSFNDLLKGKQKLEVQYQKSREQYQTMNRQKNDQILKLQQTISKYLQEWKHEKRLLNEGMTSLGEAKQNQLIQFKDKLQSEIKSLQSLRQNQNLFKDNEIAQLKKLLEIQRIKFAHTLQAEKTKYQHLLETQNLKSQKCIDQESRRLIEEITAKQRQTDMLKRDISQLHTTISQSNNQNTQLKGQISLLQTDFKSLQQQLMSSTNAFNNEKSHMHEIISQLKEEIRFNQVNFVRERDNSQFLCTQNIKLQELSHGRELLICEINQLRQLLVESSAEIQNCRNQFVIFQRDNKKLVFELQKLGAENISLQRVRRQLEQQAIKWRHNYIRAAR